MALELRQAHDADTLFRICLERGSQGITEDDLFSMGWTKEEFMRAANPLLREQRIVPTQLAPGKLLYNAVDPRAADKLHGLDNQTRLILQIIEKSGDKGSWTKTLRDQSGLPPHTITKATKELMRRQLVKEVKSMQGKMRKVFMAWDIEPSREVSGGTWYHEGQFAVDWIEQLRRRCMQILEENPRTALTLQEIHKFVVQQPGQSVPDEDNVQVILRSLVLDEQLYRFDTADGRHVYTLAPEPFDVFSHRLPRFLTKRNAAAEQRSNVVPCVQCHLRDQCRPGARICPEKCQYIANWLNGGNEADDDQDMSDW